MSDASDKLELEKLTKILEAPDDRKYKVTFKFMEFELNKGEYIELLTARNVTKKQIAEQKGLKDSDEVTDTEFYKFILNVSCKSIVEAAVNMKMKQLSQMAMGALMADLLKKLKDGENKHD